MTALPRATHVAFVTASLIVVASIVRTATESAALAGAYLLVPVSGTIIFVLGITGAARELRRLPAGA
jgi:hypothetical protein